MIRVKVPATSANMGAGFDCLGVALSLYNVIDISEIEQGLIIRNIRKDNTAPRNENNLIYRAMQRVFNEVNYTPSGLSIVQRSSIPMTRGLGSSSACIIGGMIGANILSGRQLDYRQILNLAVEMEGHPDNVTPALYGGMCVSVRDGKNTVFNSVKLNSRFKFAVMIPDYFVATKKSRGVLPESYSKQDAVYNISRAALFISAMQNGKSELLKTAVQDRMHQSYRSAYIDGMDEIFEKTYEVGAKATYLSGSGPTILSVIDDEAKNFKTDMEKFFGENNHKWRCKVLTVDNVGTVVQLGSDYK